MRRAEVRVVGATAPERVHYGAGDAAGSIKGESAMKSLQGEFRHIFAPLTDQGEHKQSIFWGWGGGGERVKVTDSPGGQF